MWLIDSRPSHQVTRGGHSPGAMIAPPSWRVDGFVVARANGIHRRFTPTSNILSPRKAPCGRTGRAWHATLRKTYLNLSGGIPGERRQPTIRVESSRIKSRRSSFQGILLGQPPRLYSRKRGRGHSGPSAMNDQEAQSSQTHQNETPRLGNISV